MTLKDSGWCGFCGYEVSPERPHKKRTVVTHMPPGEIIYEAWIEFISHKPDI